ncbi:MAG: MFS transporter [Cypionkella sp.]|nr:MFS transporter [Cypionkella sp.]
MRSALTIFALWAAGLGAAAQFGKISVLYEQLGLIYPSHAGVGIGVMLSVVGIVGLIFGITAGLVIARIGPRRAILAALLLAAAISAVQSLFPPYALMLLTRVFEGAAHLAIVIVGPTAIATIAPARFQGFAMTLWSSFFGVAFAALFYFAPPLVATYGPSLLFQLHAGWMLACAAILWCLMPADLVTLAPELPRSVLHQHLEIYASPSIAAPATGFVFYTLPFVALLTLLPAQIPGHHGPMVGVAMPLVSITLSLTLGVFLLSRMSAVRLVQLGFGISLIMAVLLWAAWGNPFWQAAFSIGLAATMGIPQGASFATIPQLNASSADRARAAGAIAQLGNLGTTSGTPLLAMILLHGGVNGLVAFLILCCAGGIFSHALQARRRFNG